MSLLSNSLKTAPAGRLDLRRLLWAAPLAGVVALVLNAVVYLVAQGPLGITLVVPGPNGPTPEPLPLIAVAAASLVPALGAGALLAVLSRFTARPLFIFQIVAAVFLLLSLGGPLSLPAPQAVRFALTVMHLTTAAAIVGTLSAAVRQS